MLFLKKRIFMNDLKISGYGDDLTVNGIRIGDLTPKQHEEIELEKGGQNYSPLEDVVVSLSKRLIYSYGKETSS
ncbi:MAG: hypothetical protein CM15mP106_6430 [Candidatus Neomarinimicrobiota bacterium]|nr:MAG: hypothetical protein CM15mP106_6430 [Candidatus Neomarinimicrobiota bacterium]